MRTSITTLVTAAALSAAVLLCAACSSTSTNSTEDLGAAAATSSKAADPEAELTEQAKSTVAHYIDLRSRLDADVTAPVGAADEIAAGQVLDLTKGDVIKRRSQGITIGGAITIVSTKITESHLTPPPATVVARVCTDTSSRTATGPGGVNVLDPNRLVKSATTLTLENAAWPDAHGWRVVGDSALQERKQEPCDA